MTADTKRMLRELELLGWNITFSMNRQVLREDIRKRYSWVPNETLDFICSIENACSEDDKAWFLTAKEFNRNCMPEDKAWFLGGDAIRWNEWEIFSIHSARQSHDVAWEARIREFWDVHMPVLISIKDDYAYFALEKERNAIVSGAAPDFEATSVIAKDITECLRLIAERDPKVEIWL